MLQKHRVSSACGGRLFLLGLVYTRHISHFPYLQKPHLFSNTYKASHQNWSSQLNSYHQSAISTSHRSLCSPGSPKARTQCIILPHGKTLDKVTRIIPTVSIAPGKPLSLISRLVKLSFSPGMSIGREKVRTRKRVTLTLILRLYLDRSHKAVAIPRATEVLNKKNNKQRRWKVSPSPLQKIIGKNIPKG